MKRDGVSMVGGLSVATLSAALAASCSAPLRTPSAAAPLSANAAPSPGPVPAERIGQMEFGRRASFVRCVSPACPAVTPKTLAPATPAGPATLSVSNRGASLAAGAVLATSGSAHVPPASSFKATPSSPSAGSSLNRELTLHFGFGEASLSRAARLQIDQVAESRPAASRIAIRGRTDSAGSPRSNQALATARANAVLDHLRVRYPQLAAAVALEAEGTCCFVAPNNTPEGRALNRRVEIVFERAAKE